MVIFDASSIIHAWDNYPLTQFPPLWNWLSDQIDLDRVIISQIAFDEVIKKSPDCGNWLKERDIQRVKVSSDILSEALRIKGLLGIEDDNYHTKGVNENDILIIATAKLINRKLISNEGVQYTLPNKLSKCKIPAVCNLQSVQVDVFNFVDYLRQSGAVFS